MQGLLCKLRRCRIHPRESDALMRSVPIRRPPPRLRPLRTTTTTTHPRQRTHTTLSKTSPGWPRGVFISYLVTKPPCPLGLYRRYVTNGLLSRFPYPITSHRPQSKNRSNRLKQRRVLSMDQCYLHAKTVFLGGGTQRSCWFAHLLSQAL